MKNPFKRYRASLDAPWTIFKDMKLPDPRTADLTGADLSGADFSRARHDKVQEINARLLDMLVVVVDNIDRLKDGRPIRHMEELKEELTNLYKTLDELGLLK